VPLPCVAIFSFNFLLAEARVVPFPEESRVLIQDVDSKENTELSSEDLTLDWRETSVESLDTVSPLEIGDASRITPPFLLREKHPVSALTAHSIDWTLRTLTFAGASLPLLRKLRASHNFRRLSLAPTLAFVLHPQLAGQKEALEGIKAESKSWLQ